MKTFVDILKCVRSVDTLVFSIALKKEHKAAEMRINPRLRLPHRKKDRLILKEVRQEASALMSASTSLAAIAEAIEYVAMANAIENVALADMNVAIAEKNVANAEKNVAIADAVADTITSAAKPTNGHSGADAHQIDLGL